jgi:hypothetical protein
MSGGPFWSLPELTSDWFVRPTALPGRETEWNEEECYGKFNHR